MLSGVDGGETLYLQEVETLPGYQLDETVHEVTLAWGQTSTVELLNEPLATLRLIKIDVETKEPIYGAVFNLYDAKNNLLGEYVTNQNGIIEFPRELPEGKYKLKEIKCDGYVVDPTIRTVELKAGETTEITVENRPMRGQIQIVKKAADDNPITKDKAGALLDGAEFTIYNDKLEVVDVIVTENGVATSKPLPLNTYAIKETSSPEYYRTDGNKTQCVRGMIHKILIPLDNGGFEMVFFKPLRVNDLIKIPRFGNLKRQVWNNQIAADLGILSLHIMDNAGTGPIE